MFSNRQLVDAFGATDATLDYGLDAMFVETELRPPSPPPWFVDIRHDRQNHTVRLNWEGDGAVFEVERATTLSGPWESCSPILPDLSFEDACGTNGTQFFYRLRQW